MKVCSKCGVEKPADEFSKKSGYGDGLQKHCKACNRTYRAANRHRIREWSRGYKSREDVKAKEKEYRVAHREHRRAYDAEHVHARNYLRRALRLGIEPVVEKFTKSDVIARYGDHCVYCETGAFEQLDHRVPIKVGGHHTLDNVRPTCAACNSSKSDADPDEWLARQAEFDAMGEDELEDAIDAEIAKWTDRRESA